MPETQGDAALRAQAERSRSRRLSVFSRSRVEARSASVSGPVARLGEDSPRQRLAATPAARTARRALTFDCGRRVQTARAEARRQPPRANEALRKSRRVAFVAHVSFSAEWRYLTPARGACTTGCRDTAEGGQVMRHAQLERQSCGPVFVQTPEPGRSGCPRRLSALDERGVRRDAVRPWPSSPCSRDAHLDVRLCGLRTVSQPPGGDWTEFVHGHRR